MQAPPNSGSSYYNYKGKHSINLMAISDSKCCFSIVDIGAEGRQSDGGVFGRSEIGIGLENNNMNLPEPTEVEVNGPKLPYVLVADEAFALRPYMMRPFPRSKRLDIRKKVFNYRLSRARRVVESSFGLLVARWRIFRKPINTSVTTAVKIVQAAVALQNFIIQCEATLPSGQRIYSNMTNDNTNLIDASAFTEMDKLHKSLHGPYAAQVRQHYADYFMNSGAVEWQWDKALNNDF